MSVKHAISNQAPGSCSWIQDICERTKGFASQMFVKFFALIMDYELTYEDIDWHGGACLQSQQAETGGLQT